MVEMPGAELRCRPISRNSFGSRVFGGGFSAVKENPDTTESSVSSHYQLQASQVYVASFLVAFIPHQLAGVVTLAS